MQTIQVVIDEKLLRETDRVVKKSRINRSALIRSLLAEHVKRVRIRELEEKERDAYRGKPQTKAEIEMWEGMQAWPED